MALPSSGPIRFSDIRTELGLSSGSISMSSTLNRTLFGVLTGQIKMSNGRGKSNRKTINIVISSNSTDVEVRNLVGSNYVAGKSDITVTVNSGVWCFPTYTGYGMLIRNFTAGDTVTLINNGLIVGNGGGGGGSAANNAGGGSHALYVNGITVNVYNNYVIYGGGGGGGEGQGVYTSVARFSSNYVSSGGGGGGQGYYGGGGGSAYTGTGNSYYGSNGAAGSINGPGGGGAGRTARVGYSGSGGAGGGWGAAGAGGGGGSGTSGWYGPYGGGAAGYYLIGSNYVNWMATGYLAGNVAWS